MMDYRMWRWKDGGEMRRKAAFYSQMYCSQNVKTTWKSNSHEEIK